MIKRILVAALALAALAPATTAFAGSQPGFIGCQFPPSSGNDLKWEDATTSVQYSNAAAAAIQDWNSSSTQFNLAKVNSGANIRVANGNFGAVWMNLELWGVTLNTSKEVPTTSCKDNDQRWDTTIVTWLNTYYMNSSTTNKRKAIYVHEIGHALGLAHTNDKNTCDISIMQIDIVDKYETCGKISSPQPEDVAAANYLYG
ncbi:matrixin family metalloprotease [Kribbella sp. NPDC051770]|uniref:matrixin family metalloprotease n=1 Tax=Kribbella sp. NPDC051770 TaxID=3155413 RepID=UPI003429CE28